jgi:hypothetical protein
MVNRNPLSWDQIKDHFVYDDIAYLSLVKNFKELGNFEDADDCYFQFRSESQDKKPWSHSSKYSDILSKLAFGYGVHPEYALSWMFILILVFTGIYGLGNGIQESTNYTCPCIIEKTEQRKSMKDRFVYGFYFGLMVFTFQSRAGKLRPTGYYKWIAITEGIFGLLLFGLFIVSLSDILIR